MIATHEGHPLNVPLNIQGCDYTELRERRPTARDILRSARKSARMTALEVDIHQLVDLCEVPREVNESLEVSDLIAAQAILRSFANPSEADVRKAVMVLLMRVGLDLATLEERTIDDLIEWLKTLEAITPR